MEKGDDRLASMLADLTLEEFDEIRFRARIPRVD